MNQWLRAVKNRFHQQVQFGRIRRAGFPEGPSRMGGLLDGMFIGGILALGAYLWFVSRTQRPVLSIGLSLTITALSWTARALWRRRRHPDPMTVLRAKVRRDYLRDGLESLNPEEFQWQIMKILLKIPGIGSIKNHRGWLETTLWGVRTAVGYVHDPQMEAVSPRQMALFLREVRSAGFTQAYYITTGAYQEGCRRNAGKSPSFKLRLLDGADLVRLMEKTGLVPEDAVLDRLLLRKHQEMRQAVGRIKGEILKPKRCRTYLAYALLFWVLASIIPSNALYYTLLSGAFFTIALCAYLIHARRSKPLQKQENLLEQTAQSVD